MAASLPFEIKNVTEEEDRIIKKYYKGYTRPFVRAGPQGYLQTPRYADHAADIFNLEVRPDDVWVVTFSRSGTTWLQELTWLVANDLDFDTANSVPLFKRFAFIELKDLFSMYLESKSERKGRVYYGGERNLAFPVQASDVQKVSPNPHKHSATDNDFTNIGSLPSPRYIKSHLPFSLLPTNLLDAKVLYIARDVRDVAVSFFFMHKLFRYFDDEVEFREFWELFKKDLLFHMPIFPHIEEAWLKKDHPNVLFLFYEEMQNDLRSVIDRVCQFFNKEYSNEQKEALAKHLSFENMKPKHDMKKGESSEIKFMRKGKSGNWVNYFDEQMKKEAEEYIQKHLEKTDLRFPEVTRFVLGHIF